MKWTFLATFALLMGIASTAHAQKFHFNTSTVVPAATGEVKFKKDNNNNYEMEVDVENLAKPQQLTPPKTCYMVWADGASDGAPKGFGRIHTGTSLLSKQLKGSLKSVLTFKPTRVYITAEMEGEVQKPDSTIVLTTNSF